MKRFTLVLAFLLAFSSVSFAQTTDLPPAAESVCQKLFEYLDAGQFKESFELAAEVVKEEDSVELWFGHMESWRGSMGQVKERSLIRVEKVKKFADLPEGDYILAVYRTNFSAHPESEEHVVLAGSETEGFTVAGYEVQYNRWPEALKIIGNGIFLVFLIMGLLAGITHLVGVVVQASEKKAAAPEKKG